MTNTVRNRAVHRRSWNINRLRSVSTFQSSLDHKYFSEASPLSVHYSMLIVVGSNRGLFAAKGLSSAKGTGTSFGILHYERIYYKCKLV